MNMYYINNIKNRMNIFSAILLLIVFFLFASLFLPAYSAERNFEKELRIGQKLIKNWIGLQL